MNLEDKSREMEIIRRNQTPLTKDQILSLNEKHGYFQFADAQGDVTVAFVRDIERIHGISESHDTIKRKHRKIKL